MQTLRMDDEPPHIEVIPCEIMIDIFDKLSHRDRKKARLVCQRWNKNLVNSADYFTFRAKWTNRSLKSVLKSNLRLNHLILQNMTKTMPNKGFPDVKEAILGWRNSEVNVDKFFKGCEKTAECLTITELSLGEISRKALSKSLSEIVWNDLAKLKLCVSNLSLALLISARAFEFFESKQVTLTKNRFQRDKSHLESCIVLLELIKVKRVKELDLDFEVGHKSSDLEEEESRLFQSWCLAFCEFISRHTNSIKVLKCSLGVNRGRNKFSIPEIPPQLKESMTQQLNLESCTMEFCGVCPIGNLVDPAFFGSKLRNLDLGITLKSLDWLYHVAQDRDGTAINLDKNLQTIFAVNGKCLRKIRLNGLGIMNFNWFETCTRLKTVEAYHTFLPPSLILGETPTQPFEASSRTLHSVTISHFIYADICWFENCAKLENLDISVDVLRANDSLRSRNFLRNTPKFKLKKLDLCIFHKTDEGCGEMEKNRKLQNLLDHSSQTLKHMTLFGEIYNISMPDMLSLKYLKIEIGLRNEVLLNCTASNFINLTKLRISTCCNSDVGIDTINWIVENLQNLEYFETLSSPDLPILQRFLSMPKIKNIVFYVHKKNILQEILAYCQGIPGLELRIPNMEKRGWDQYENTLLVDRDIYSSTN